VRFAKLFGYAGFSDFQELFKAHVKSVKGGGRNGANQGVRTKDNANLHFIRGLVAASHTSLGRIDDDFDLATFERMIAILGRAGLIYIIGSKRAFPVTAYISLTLSQQGVKNVLVDNIGSTAFDQIGCLGPTDAVLAVSFSPYNSITPDLVAAARTRKARVVSITDSALSPLVKLSDAWLEVVESDFAGFRSLAATLAVGMALAQGVRAQRAAASPGAERLRN
jgi:DNA-binding MurR/RpiR family transcriptional regulator